MRLAAAIALIALTSVAFAATNATNTASVSSTNVVPAKVSKKASKPSRPQCEAITLSGNRCKRHAIQGSPYCSQHTAINRKREKDKSGKDARQGGVSNGTTTERR